MAEYGGRRRRTRRHRGGRQFTQYRHHGPSTGYVRPRLQLVPVQPMALMEGGRRSRRRSRRTIRGGFGGTGKAVSSGASDTIFAGQGVNAASKAVLKKGSSGIVKQGATQLIGKGVAKGVGRAIPGVGAALIAYDIGSEVHDSIQRGKAQTAAYNAAIQEESQRIAKRPLFR